MMVYLDGVIVLASMVCVSKSKYYELHLTDEICSMLISLEWDSGLYR